MNKMKTRRLFCGWMLSILLTMASSIHAAESDRLFLVHDAAEGLADNGAQVIKCTKTGRMVICSIGHINFYNGSSFNHIDASPEDSYELPKYEGHYHLYFDKTHHLWVKDKYQVTCVDLMTERFVSDVQGLFNEMGFKGKADDLFVDDDGRLLILTGQNLFSCQTKKSYPVRKDKKLQDIGEYKDQLLLLFYDDSTMEAYNMVTGKLVYTKTLLDQSQAVKYNKSSVLLSYQKGYYQIRNGKQESVLLYVDALSGESKVLMSQPYHMNNMAIHGGLLYVASQYGYWTYHLATGEKHHYATLTSIKYQEIQTDINDIAFDLQGGMWIGTQRKGLLYSKPYTSPFKVYPIESPMAKRYKEMIQQKTVLSADSLPRRVNCIYQDSRGWTWQGTYIGLKRFRSPRDSHPLLINNSDGLNNNVIHSIIEDNDHNLWVSTSNGISCLVFEKDSLTRVVSFGENDNIPACSFENGLVMKLEDGSIIMQSLDNIVKFDPAAFHTTKRIDIKLYPKIIRLSVNGRTIRPGMEIDGDVILDHAITRTKDINVNYYQNNISLLVTGLNYFRPSQTYYRIRVKGFRNEWEVYSMHDGTGRVDEKGLLHYPIVSIPPGKYQIEIQTSMTPDDWAVEPFVWNLTVKEPWWRMTIVYLILGLLLLGMLIANFVFYNRNTRMKLNRMNIESGTIKRIKAFAIMCENMQEDELSPSLNADFSSTDADDAFANVMVKVIPYVSKNSTTQSMSSLAKKAQMDVKAFYEVMTSHLYKSPNRVVLTLRLQRAADMLLHTDKSVDVIAKELHFSSSNYLIASFYHQYHQTPDDYRASNPR